MLRTPITSRRTPWALTSEHRRVKGVTLDPRVLTRGEASREHITGVTTRAIIGVQNRGETVVQLAHGGGGDGVSSAGLSGLLTRLFHRDEVWPMRHVGGRLGSDSPVSHPFPVSNINKRSNEISKSYSMTMEFL